jgi:TolB-like protein/DNA-binding winged helix-turn-helix (wHTH) protein
MADVPDERWQVGDLTIDIGGQAVIRDGTPIILPQLSFKFLLALVRAAPRLVSAEELMEQVWTGIFVNSETVTQRAKLLRDALGDDPKHPRYFSVRRGAGYQLVPLSVRLDSNEPAQSGPWKNLSKHWKLALYATALGLISLSGLTAITVWHGGQEATQGASLRVAVLPFDNLSSDPSDAYIARSIPEMVLNRLSSMRGLTVIARESALMSPVSGASAKEAGQQLQAAYVVKGSIQRTAKTLRVTCFVVDTSNGVRLWSERFDWPVERLYALQDRIAERVAASLETRTRGIGELAPAEHVARNPDAYLAYLKGKSLLGRFTVAETDAAAGQFERAVKLDPEFAPAMVALFDARMQRADLRREDLGPVRERYQPLLEKAQRIDPDDGEALFARAMWTNVPRDEKAALFRRAAALDPSNSRGLTAFAQFLGGGSNGGALDGIGDGNVTRDGEGGAERKRLLNRVLAIDPLNPRARFVAIMQKLGELTPEQLEREQVRALELDPGNYPLANRYASRRWMFHGETAEAIEQMERVIGTDPQNPWGPHLVVAFYLDANDLTAARAVAGSTPASRDSTRALLAQYRGDWRSAGQAALGRRGFLFNRFQNWLWAESVRDYVLRTRQFDLGAEAIASRYGFDLRNPRTESLPQSTVAPVLGHILLAAGKRQAGERLLAQTIQWIDGHPSYGIVGNYRTKAASLMLLGERDLALSILKASIETGHDIRHWWYLVERDLVWVPVHGDPRFKAIAEYCRQAAHIQRAKLDSMRRAGKIPARPPSGGA